MTDRFLLEFVSGTTQSGKTHETARRVAHEPNLLVWDAKSEFHKKFRCRRVTESQLRKIAATGAVGRYAFDVPITLENFEIFCRCAWLWIRVMHEKGRSKALVIEELADVSPPGKAPFYWGQIVRKSMYCSPHVYAITQRAAESDKTVKGNASVSRCHSLATPADRKDMAGYLDTSIDRVAGLNFAKYEYLERDRGTRELWIAGKGVKRRRLAAAD